jgi:predicted nuclease with TOPRIM domain
MEQDEIQEILYRLDERTARIDSRMERLDKEISKFEVRVEDKIHQFEDELSDLDKRVTRNSIVINAFTLGVASVATYFVTQIRHIMDHFRT